MRRYSTRCICILTVLLLVNLIFTVSVLVLCLGLCGGVHGFVVNTATNDAVFLPWSEWTCLNTSGSCFQNRERNCSTGNVNDCHGRHSEATLCWSDCSVTTPTAVPTSSSTSAIWSTWFYGPCSATCGTGTRHGIRRCSSGTDKDCVGPSTRTDACQETACGVWSSWFYDSCSATCGPGTKQGIRRCSSGHEPDCKGSAFQTTTCEDHPCHAAGMWSAWSNWSPCSHSCGDDGKEYRYRSCNQTNPQHGGADCQGSNMVARTCLHATSCQVDGMWSAWSNWSGCSSSCGDHGKEYRIRSCTHPHPQHGGADCQQGSNHTARTCQHSTPCPVDGMWSVWSNWSHCSSSCGDHGKEYRNRSCTHPHPQHGGADCQGSNHTERTCQHPTPCPVDGMWSTWSNWGKCSSSCGDHGKEYRNRSCTHPHPQHGGADCQGSNHTSRNCTHTTQCPVDGMWSVWSNWSKCSSSCGDHGKEYRNRSCTHPHPQHGGADCQGSNYTARTCLHLTPCPVDGMWSAWSNWSDCSNSCGNDGKEYSIRTCSNPHPQHGGIDCQGAYVESRTCLHLTPCPVDGMWSAWSNWSKCSSTCGDHGREYRNRSCTHPHPQHGGADCKGSKHIARLCQNITICPVDGNWSVWGSWSSCTHTCGSRGTQHRERNCSNPAPSHGGKQCQGDPHETNHCPGNPLCPADVCRIHYGYVYIESFHTGLCLRFYHTTKKSWSLARSYCHRSGGDLATLYTSSIIDAADRLTLHTLGHGDAFWIGLHGRDLSSHHSSSWYWVNSTAHFGTNRFSGRSLHEGKSDRCASVEHDGHWKADHCTELHSFLCEIPV